MKGKDKPEYKSENEQLNKQTEKKRKEKKRKEKKRKEKKRKENRQKTRDETKQNIKSSRSFARYTFYHIALGVHMGTGAAGVLVDNIALGQKQMESACASC